MVAPDVTIFHTYPVVLGKELVGVVETGDVGNIVTELEADAITERLSSHLEGISPADGDLITLGAEIGHIFLGSRSTVHGRQGLTGGKHILGVADVGFRTHFEAIS